MAPRQPKADAEEGDFDSLKPKMEGAKVDKKAAKPKVSKAKAEKADKPKAVKAKAEKPDKPDKPATANKTDKKVDDKKEKVKAVVGEEAEQAILAYLKSQNRPFSATEVSANLHGKVTKTVADKLLKELGDKGHIGHKATNGKEKGSQFVFWTLQDPADAASAEELAAMDETIAALRANAPTLKTDLKVVGFRLGTLKAAPTTAELAGIVEAARTENADRSAKLLGFKEGAVKQISKEELEKVERDFKYWAARRNGRKNGFDGLEDVILGTGSMTKEELWENAGVEEDQYC